MRNFRFERIMKKYRNAIYSYAYYFSGSHEDAEDLTQEALIKIWRNMPVMRPFPGKSWVMKVTRNHCIDWARARKTDCAGLVSPGAAAHYCKVSESHIIRNVDRNELKKKIEAAIAGLPVCLRETIILREIQGMKYEEISRALDMPLNTVRANIHRGRRLMREHLNAAYGREFQRRCV